MTATTPTKKRRRFRLSGLEMFGFIDTPGAASNTPVVIATVRTPSPVAVAPTPPKAQPSVQFDPFQDWKPDDVASRLPTRRVRWGLILVMTALVLGLGMAGYWLYQIPQTQANQAMADLDEAVAAVEPDLAAFGSLNENLTSPEIDPALTNRVLLSLDTTNRGLFDAAAAVPTSEADVRGRAIGAAGSITDAQRLFTDAFTYRNAVIPILVPPALESDPSLTTLEEAAAIFTEWQTKFDATRTILSDSEFNGVSTDLDVMSARLSEIQLTYLDGLRLEDAATINGALTSLTTGLEGIETHLFEELKNAQDRIKTLITGASTTLSALLVP